MSDIRQTPALPQLKLQLACSHSYTFAAAPPFFSLFFFSPLPALSLSYSGLAAFVEPEAHGQLSVYFVLDDAVFALDTRAATVPLSVSVKT